jgi:hypothetical protein
MDFSNVISSAGANCFSHGTVSQGNFMDVYGTQSRGSQKHSTDLQLFIIHIKYDNDTLVDEKMDSTTSTATATVSTIASTTVSNTLQTTTINSVVPQHIHHAYHLNPIVDDRLRTWFKLLWYYHEYLNSLGMEHVLPTWYPCLKDYVRMENTDSAWNFAMPRNPPLAEGMTLPYMKPLEQLFEGAPTNFVNQYPRVTSGETLNHITPPNERTEIIRMALEDNPIHQFHADLDRIPFHLKEEIHMGLGNLGNRMSQKKYVLLWFQERLFIIGMSVTTMVPHYINI